MDSVRVDEIAFAEGTGLAEEREDLFLSGDKFHELICSFTNENLRNCAEDDFPIEREGPVIDVGHVEGHPCFKVYGVAAFDGPEAG